MSTASRLRRERVTQRSAGKGGTPRRRTPTGMARLRYAFDTTMSRGVSALIIYLGLIVAVAVVLFAVVVHIFDLGPTNNPIRTAYNALLHTIDTGTIAGDTGTGYEIAALFITIVGLFLFSAFIGILATVLDEQLTNLRKGRSLVLETGHALILGWSPAGVLDHLRALDRQRERGRRPSIVVLADRDKVEMEDTIRAARAGRCAARGSSAAPASPINLADLELVAHPTRRVDHRAARRRRRAPRRRRSSRRCLALTTDETTRHATGESTSWPRSQDAANLAAAQPGRRRRGASCSSTSRYDQPR